MRTSFILHNELMEAVDILSNAEAGKFIKAIFHYSNYGELPEKLSGSTAILFSMVRSQLDRDAVKYEKTCAARAEAGRKSAEVKQSRKQSEATADDGEETANTANATPDMADMANAAPDMAKIANAIPGMAKIANAMPGMANAIGRSSGAKKEAESLLKYQEILRREKGLSPPAGF